jgi:hypothetical protein
MINHSSVLSQSVRIVDASMRKRSVSWFASVSYGGMVQPCLSSIPPRSFHFDLGYFCEQEVGLVAMIEAKLTAGLLRGGNTMERSCLHDGGEL